MTCTHRDSLGRWTTGPHYGTIIGAWGSHHKPIGYRCAKCGGLCALGEAADFTPRTLIEIDAARRATFNRETNYRPGADRFDFCPDTNSGELCWLCEALYLASVIATHAEGE